MTAVRPTWGPPRPDHLSTEPALHTKPHRDEQKRTAPLLTRDFPTPHPQIHTVSLPPSLPPMPRRKYTPRPRFIPTFPLPGLAATAKEAAGCCRHIAARLSRTTTHERRPCCARRMEQGGCLAANSTLSGRPLRFFPTARMLLCPGTTQLPCSTKPQRRRNSSGPARWPSRREGSLAMACTRRKRR